MPYAGEVTQTILRKKASKGTFTFSSFHWAVLLPPISEVPENTGIYTIGGNPGTQMGEVRETWRWGPYITQPGGTLGAGPTRGHGCTLASTNPPCSHMVTCIVSAWCRGARGYANLPTGKKMLGNSPPRPPFTHDSPLLQCRPLSADTLVYARELHPIAHRASVHGGDRIGRFARQGRSRTDEAPGQTVSQRDRPAANERGARPHRHNVTADMGSGG